MLIVASFFKCCVVTMQAQKEMPAELQSKDKFLLQSVIAPVGSTPKDISPEMVGYGNLYDSMHYCILFWLFINMSGV